MDIKTFIRKQIELIDKENLNSGDIIVKNVYQYVFKNSTKEHTFDDIIRLSMFIYADIARQRMI